MRKIAKILGVLLLCATPPAWGVCTRQASEAADKNLDAIKTWKDLHAAFQLYRQCDDGALAEGYSEIVARLLADHWNDPTELLEIARSDTAFEAWAISHLDETTTNNDLVKIEGLARTACPKGADGLCRHIRQQLLTSECPQDFPDGVGCVAKRHPL